HRLAILGLALAFAGLGGGALAQGPERGVGVVEKRVALVIGNSRYPTAPLNNPGNDARAMSRVLRSLGFEVLSHEDSTWSRCAGRSRTSASGWPRGAWACSTTRVTGSRWLAATIWCRSGRG